MKTKSIYKILIVLFISTVFFSSCNETPKEENFVLNGNVFDAKSGTVYMLRKNPVIGAADTLATDTIVDGKFMLNGKVDCPSSCYLRFVVDVDITVEGEQRKIKAAYTDVIVIDNVEMHYETWVRDMASRKIWGNELHTKVLQLVKEYPDLNTLSLNAKALYRYILINKDNISPDVKEDLIQDWKKANALFSESRGEIIQSKLDSDESTLYKGLLLETYGVNGQQQIDIATELIDKLTLIYGEDAYLIRSLMARIEKAKKEDKVAIGKKYIDVSALDMEGNEIKLSSIVGDGKYVLLDFWASWCNPCIKEMPVLKKDYKRFHDKGFEIFAISIDKQKEPWETASMSVNFPWTNTLVIAEKEKNAQIIYSVRAIPANYLIDPTGKIIASNLRGKSLEEKLIEVLGE